MDTLFMPCSSALPERVARVAWSTELGEVKTCLYAYAALSNGRLLKHLRDTEIAYRDKELAL